ncbi:TPA: hypothetical protein I8569_000597 [Klebsiella oxytoca]|nr:hypothetical protein [Klebsiella oxytoca]
MTDITELAQLRAELSNPAIGSKDHLRKLALSLVEALEKAQTINAAAEKLVRCKGRYHSELNYRALADLFGVTMPDFPPLDGECRTVTVKLPQAVSAGGQGYQAQVERILTAAGIKVEAE